MTPSTPVERRRARARRVLLSLSTILCSGLAVPAPAADYTPPKVDTRTPTGVNLADGSFIISNTDLAIGTLTLERFHMGGAKDPNRPFFGPHMSHNFDMYVSPNTTPPAGPLPSRSKPVVHLGSTSIGPYVKGNYSSVVIPSSDEAQSGKLTIGSSDITASDWVYTAQDGTVYTFNHNVPAAGSTSQRIGTVDYPNGRKLSFSYNGSNQLKLVSDSSGYGIVFDYNANGNVSAACGFNLAQQYVSATSTCASAGLKVSYGYTNNGYSFNGSAEPLLTSVTDVMNKVTTYGYTTATNRLTCVTPPSFSSCQISNVYGNAVDATLAHQVTQQTLGDGSVWNYLYSGDYAGSRDPALYVVEQPSASTVVTDPTSAATTYNFVKTSPYSKQDANGHTTSYVFRGGTDYEHDSYGRDAVDEGSLLVSVKLHEGNQFIQSYGPFNVPGGQTFKDKAGGDVVSLAVGFDCLSDVPTPTCAKPVWKKDANGKQTDYHYTSWGALDWEMQPAPGAGAARPLKLYTYVQKYAYVKNASGTLVASGGLIWLPSTETQCETTSTSTPPTCAGGAPQMVTSYEYGTDGTADNLLLRGKVVTANGQSLRTCYRYDAQANRVAETSPRGTTGLASCT